MTESSTLSLAVHAIDRLSPSVARFELRDPSQSPLPEYAAGAHVDIHLPNDISRSYSLIGDGGDRSSYVIAVQREPQSRGGSSALHEAVRQGDRLPVSLPRNNFPLVEDARHVVLIGGGIGLTPLIGMAERLAALGRSWELHYSVREPAMAAFLPWCEAHAPQARINYTGGPGGARLNLHAIAADAPHGTHFYCCGPVAMLDAFADATSHLPPERVHLERFSGVEPVTQAQGFTIELAKSGRMIEVPPGQTILQALTEADVYVPHACTEGICGLCETRILSGTPVHRDLVKLPEEHEEQGTLMICCAGAASDRLVLDV